MLHVVWPSSRVQTKAQIWRVLDLSGMSKSVRDSRNFTKSGYTYIDGQKVNSLKDTVAIGKLFTLELRFPNGKVISEDIMLIHRVPNNQKRSLDPHTRNYRG